MILRLHPEGVHRLVVGATVLGRPCFEIQNKCGFDVGFRVLTALKGWVGHAASRRGALHMILTFIFIILFDLILKILIFYVHTLYYVQEEKYYDY